MQFYFKMLTAFLIIFQCKCHSAVSVEKDLEHSDMGDAFVFVFVRNRANMANSFKSEKLQLYNLKDKI
jgi:hypothetical protein